MIKISGVLSVLAVAMFFSAAPVRGDDTYETDMPKIRQPAQRDECLIVAKNCTDSYRADSVDQRIDRLNKEIAKGTDVYTEEELKTLDDQLNWISEENGGDNSY